MIKEVKEFLEAFFQKELKARTAFLKPDNEKAESSVRELHKYCIEDCYNRLGVVTPVKVMSHSFYEDYAHFQGYTIPRHLYKISKYKNIKYGEFYLAYVSDFIPDEDWADIYRMQYCFLVAKVGQEYKVVGEASSDPDDRSKWDYDFGDPDINFNSLGEFIETERYIEPIDDKDNPSLEKYKRDE